MLQVQKKDLQTFLPPALFVGAVFFAGSSRLVHLFPNASRKGLLCGAAFGGASVYGSRHLHPNKERDSRRRWLTIIFLGVGAAMTPKVAKTLIGRADLNSLASLRFAALEGILFGCVETAIYDSEPIPPRKIPKLKVTTPFNLVRGADLLETIPDISVSEMNREEHTVRGFDKMAQGPWFEKQVKALCGEKAFVVEGILTSEVEGLLDLEDNLRGNTEDIPTVMLINCRAHYSVVVHDPVTKKITCFNSLSTDVNPYETRVIAAMSKVFGCEEVERNSQPPQKGVDGWSCAFHVIDFLAKFLAGNSMQAIDGNPMSQKELADMLTEYVLFLSKVQVAIPEDFILFYNVALADKSLLELKNAMKVSCQRGVENKTQGGRERERLDAKMQIEVMLIKLWMMQRDAGNTLNEFVDLMGDFSDNQRRFLDKALNRLDWTREAISNDFRSAYYAKYRHPISPD